MRSQEASACSEDDFEEEGESEQEEMQNEQGEREMHQELQEELLQLGQEEQEQQEQQRQQEQDALSRTDSQANSDSTLARPASRKYPIEGWFHCLKPCCPSSKRYTGRHQHRDGRRVTKGTQDSVYMFLQ